MMQPEVHSLLLIYDRVQLSIPLAGEGQIFAPVVWIPVFIEVPQ